MPHEELQYWNFNLPQSQRSSECPEYLLNLNDKDRRLIGSWDSDYQIQDWVKVKELIRTNRIDLFQRAPSELRRYRQFIFNIIQEYGSVMKFVLRTRLHWDVVVPSSTVPFDDPTDVKILYNDWPYGVDPRIVHLVVWTKFNLEDDPETDDLTPAARQVIDTYVDQTFRAHTRNPDHVVWFKNWKSLKSVHAVEHFHVMLFEPDMKFVEKITGGDVPLSVKLKIENEGEIVDKEYNGDKPVQERLNGFCS
jgi:hypothetical protein